jgi:CO/xanthine dehydrogenase Mo-binding subunit
MFDFDGSGAFIKVELDGRITLITGEGDTGQGAWSVLAQVAAEEMGAKYEDVQVLAADTDVAPYCLGAWAARVTVAGGNAVRLAARDAKKQLFDVGAQILEASAGDLEASNSKLFVKGVPSRSLSFAEVSKAAIYRLGGGSILGRGIYDNPTEVQDKTTYGNFSPCYTFTVQVARVEVDPGTGQIKVISLVAADDVGKVINPAMAEGQAHGCISQGLGLTLMEEMVWDGGKLVNGNFMDYRVPTAMDLPSPELMFVPTEEPLGPFGAKSASEISIVPVPAAIANAIYDAVGIRIRNLPITSEKVFRSLRAKANV